MTLKGLKLLEEEHYKKLDQYINQKIIDDYAIMFAEWVIDTDNKPVGEFTIKELLEIFKKEKGL